MAFDNSIPLPLNSQDEDDPKPEFDTLRKRRGSDRTGYVTSVNTPYKQQSFEAAIDLNIALYGAIKNKFPSWSLKPYCYIDLNAGRGQDEDGQDGSPLIFLRLARERRLAYAAQFFERDPNNAQTLKHLVNERGYAGADVRCQDHHVLINEISPKGKVQYGAIYADPSNATPSWDVLKALNKRAPRMDMLINLACASYKRMIALPDYVHLDQHLYSLKLHWLVREPIDNFQWSILFGTNWVDYPELRRHGFYSIKTDEGSAILEKLVYTHNERRGSDQLELL